ncbi:hypothetical protein [Hyphomicrobium sp.]|nr:hypothetical protein [Hyphomicrobium sp.]MCC7253643.1 hypothetical protein [Hyphomicrobium sp.]
MLRWLVRILPLSVTTFVIGSVIVAAHWLDRTVRRYRRWQQDQRRDR